MPGPVVHKIVLDDPETIPRTALMGENLPYSFAAMQLDHTFISDNLAYYCVGWRRNDGPWMQRIDGEGTPRTISHRALGRTYHHIPSRCDKCRG